MAFVQKFWELEMQFMDSGGVTAKRTVRLQGTLASAAATNAAAVVAAYAGATKCYVVGFRLASVQVNDDPSGPPAMPPAGDVLITDEGLVTVNLVTIGKHANLSVPAPVDDCFAGTSGKNKNIMVTGGSLDAILSLYESGANASLSDGEFVSGTAPFLSGIRASKGRRFSG